MTTRLASVVLSILTTSAVAAAQQPTAAPAPAPAAPAAVAPASQPEAAPPGAAPEVAAPAPAPAHADRGAFLVGAKIGGILPFKGLDPNAVGGIELGYVLPYLRRSFAATVEISYSQPTSSGTTTGDPRVADGTYSWHLTQRELVFAPTLLYRLARIPRVTPFVGFGPRVYLLESLVKGSAGGAAMSTTTEQSTKVGVGIPLGVEVKLGPGSLTGDFLFEWGPIDHEATGKSTSTVGGNLRLGYRFLF